MQGACQSLLDVGRGLALLQVVLVYGVVVAMQVAVGVSDEIPLVECIGSVQVVAEAVVGHVYMGEYEAAPVNLHAHLLAEGAAHEQTVVVAAGGTLFGEFREVQILEHVSFDALIVGQQLL